jgi:hypothetical protein
MAGVHHNRRTRERVLKEFRRVGRVDLACASCAVDRSTFYDWLRKDPEFKAEFEACREEVSCLLEDEAVRRAYHGTMKPASAGGKLVMVTEFSDRLLEFLLKCRNRAVFGDRQQLEHSGPGGKDLFPAQALEEWVKSGANTDRV